MRQHTFLISNPCPTPPSFPIHSRAVRDPVLVLVLVDVNVAVWVRVTVAVNVVDCEMLRVFVDVCVLPGEREDDGVLLGVNEEERVMECVVFWERVYVIDRVTAAVTVIAGVPVPVAVTLGAAPRLRVDVIVTVLTGLLVAAVE